MNRTCKSCGEDKLISEFYPHKQSKDGYLRHCKVCISSKRKKEYCSTKARTAHIKSKYGLSEKDYTILFEKQQGRCKICGKENPDDYHGLCVDHDHKTGKVRGLLCHNCNSALGNFYDNVDYLLSAVDYLRNQQ
ncbi:putative integration and excision endonuclease VII [Synechococcus phage S-B28]|jgi:hypothetical protein|uniref:Putative integration and excision endonuclease VII n=1 Tax=Synechococcus phage S-B28 TaxID=2545435 RepID=A0A482IEC4_9CAUD|nr:endonuclease VII [Synechococcus phage S-B28]QBP05798.1 putative integration and excision endonuclease VII [Synechococcus phage S-B28]